MTDKLNVFDIHVHNFVHDTCEQETDKHCIIFLLLNNKFYQRPLTTLECCSFGVKQQSLTRSLDYNERFLFNANAAIFLAMSWLEHVNFQ
jgi:hypothetical protein